MLPRARVITRDNFCPPKTCNVRERAHSDAQMHTADVGFWGKVGVEGVITITITIVTVRSHVGASSFAHLPNVASDHYLG